MNKIFSRKYDETYYEETMPDGLDVIVWHKPAFTTSSCIFAAPYGSLDSEQADAQGNHYQFPAGTAHFLEHKLFESDHGDVMNDFSRMGASVNAYTGYAETVYYFTASEKDITEPLNLLLDFVQNLSITDESVEKEKGIIDQELSMYQQMPDSRLILDTMKAMYRNHPLKNDIGGTEESVSRITKPILEKCYAVNYHPANMMAVIVTPCDPETVMETVRRNQAGKIFEKPVKVFRSISPEPEEVCQERTELFMDVSETKACVGYKLKAVKETDRERAVRDWALRMALDACFSPVNPDYQVWLDQKRITPYFSCESDLGRDYAMILFTDEAQDPDAFQAFTEEMLQKCLRSQIRESTLSQLKSRAIGENMHLFNSPYEISVNYFRERMNGVSLFENFDLIDSLTPVFCRQITENLDISCRTLTVIRGNGGSQ